MTSQQQKHSVATKKKKGKKKINGYKTDNWYVCLLELHVVVEEIQGPH